MLEPTPEFLAARLALLALRSSFDEDTPLVVDRVLLDLAGPPMSNNEAAALLAAKPKPLFCDAKPRDGTLAVSCRPRSEADALHHPHYEIRRREQEQYGFMGFLQDQYGPGDHLVAVFGRDDSLIVPQSAVERWSREYQIDAAGYDVDDIDNPWAESEPAYVEARRKEAKGILRFHAPVTPSYFSAMPLFNDSNEVVASVAEDHLVQMARMNHSMLRALIDSSNDVTASGAWQRKQLEAAKEHLKQTATMMKHVFSGRAMPPDVAAFVEGCDKHFGHP